MIFANIVIFAKHFILPGLFLVWLAKRNHASVFDWFFMVFLTGAYLVFIYLTGEWVWYSYHLRTATMIAFVLISLVSIRRLKGKPFWKKHNPRENFGIIFSLFLGVIFVGLSYWAYWGGKTPRPTVALQFPLKHGLFYVIEGGNSPIINKHHFFPPTPEKYSIDIVKVFPAGNRARGFTPSDFSAYAIYGDSVFSPLSGVVEAVVDTMPETPIGEEINDEARMMGNHIVIAADTLKVVLAHLRPNAASVAPGDSVRVGEFLSRVGNSGASPEPHLHIHASRPSTHPTWDRQGIAILFNGRFLVKNDKIPRP